VPVLQRIRLPAQNISLKAWLPVLIGLLVLYIPTFYGLSAWLWLKEDYAHGPVILAISIWLFWRERAALLSYAPTASARTAAFALLVPGLLFYVVGRSYTIYLFELGALVPILAGCVLAICGWSALRVFWFPILFTVFMIPLPGLFVDALTGPLKQYISAISAQILYSAGYPIARDGVVVTIGQYQLLIADACSGLHSMFSLVALGALLIYLSARASGLHNALMLVSILPIAFAANIARVLALILITYHFGDRAGQGFLHEASGVVVLMIALVFLLLLDTVLALIIKLRISA